MMRYQHVVDGAPIPGEVDLHVVHGTDRRPELRYGYTQPHRYTECTGQAASGLASAEQARQWAADTRKWGWPGAYLDTVDWRNPADVDIVNAVRDGLDGWPLLLNGWPWRSVSAVRGNAPAANAFLAAGAGLQWECARLGDAARILPQLAGHTVLWLVCGPDNDPATRYQEHEAEFAAQLAKHPEADWYLGRRPEKITGKPQRPR